MSQNFNDALLRILEQGVEKERWRKKARLTILLSIND